MSAFDPTAAARLPAGSKFLQIEGFRQHVLDTGTGAPVLFVHGNFSWSYQWRHMIRRLAPTHRCIAPDLLGMGLSQPTGRRLWTITDRIRHLESLIDTLVEHHGAPSHGWTLVCHDWGGPIGLGWAATTPQRLARLVVLNSVGFAWPPEYRLPPYARAVRASRLLRAVAEQTNFIPRAATRHGVTIPMPAAVRTAYLLPYQDRQRRRAVVDFVRHLPSHRDDPLWQAIDPTGNSANLAHLPVLLLWGLRDPIVQPVLLKEWRARCPHAEVRAFPDAGHFVQEDRAHETTDAVAAFLRNTPAGPGTGNIATPPVKGSHQP